MTSDSITPEGFERILKDLFTDDESLELDEAFAQIAVTRAYITATQLDDCREELKKLELDGKKFQLGELLMYLGHMNTTAFKQVLICLSREVRYCEWCYQIYESSETPGDMEELPPCAKCNGPTRSPGRRSSTRALFPKKPSLPSPIPPPSKVYRLGKYLVQREIARGGMGVVYEAEDPELKRHVALKVLRNVGASSEYIRRLHREASIGAQLQHPNIVRVYEVSMAEDAAGHQNHFIAMEYIAGNTFADVLKESPRHLPRLLDILADVTRGMDFAHKKGVIHRDLKPPNVLIEDTGRVVLTDFGLARAESLGSQMTRTWAVMGTPEYMAPEQVEGKTSEINQRTDVYALGVMLYEIITGAPPFVAEVPATLYQKILHEEPPRPTKVNTGIPFDLELICLKAMSRDQNARYEDAEEFLHDLERYLKHEPIKARPYSLIYRVRKKLVKRKRLVVAVVAMLVFITGLGIFGFEFLRRKEEGWQKNREDQEDILTRHNTKAEQERKDARERAIRDLRDRMKTALDAALEFRRAGNLVSMKKYVARAEIACREALEREPDFAEAHYRLGRMYRVVMENEKALTQQELALEIDPNFAPALYERIVLTSWDYQAKVAALEKKAWQVAGSQIIDKKLQGDEIVLHIPSRDELVKGDPDTHAMEMQIKNDLLHLQDRLEKHPDLIQKEEITLARGLYSWVTGNLEEAEKFLSSAINLNPYLEEGYDVLAQLELSRKAFKASIGWRTEGLENDRGYLPHLENRGLARFYWAMEEKNKGEDPIHHFEIAIRDYEKAIELDSERGNALLNRALISMHWGVYLQSRGEDPTSRYEAALDQLNEASRRSPDLVQIGLANGNIRVHMGLYLQQKGGNPQKEYAEALKALNKVIERDREHFQGWSNRATARYYMASYEANRSGNADELFEGAVSDFGQALKLFPTNIQLWSDRGLIRASWAEFGKLRGKDPRPLYKKAIYDFEQAKKMNENLSSTWVRLASVTGKLMSLQIRDGKDPEAIKQIAILRFNRALDLAPKNAECWAGRAAFNMEYALYLMSKNNPQTDRHFQFSINDYTRAIQLKNSVYPWRVSRCNVWLTRAKYLLVTGKNPGKAFHEALHQADFLVKKSPNWLVARLLRAHARSSLATFHGMTGKDPDRMFNLAIEDLTKALEISPNHASTILSRGNTKLEWGKMRISRKMDAQKTLEEAIEDFNQVEKLNPNMPNLWGNRGVTRLFLASTLKTKGKAPEPNFSLAVEDLDEAVKLLPNEPSVLMARGNSYFAWGRHLQSIQKEARPQLTRALSDMKAAMKLNPTLRELNKDKLKFLEDYFRQPEKP